MIKVEGTVLDNWKNYLKKVIKLLEQRTLIQIKVNCYYDTCYSLMVVQFINASIVITNSDRYSDII